jgi:hypothetical protein
VLSSSTIGGNYMSFSEIFKSGLNSLKLSLKRFPCALIFSTLTTVILIFLVNTENYYIPETIDIFKRLALTTSTGFPLFLGIKTIFERKTSIKPVYKIITRITAAAILISYYLFLLKEINMVTTSRFIAINLTLYLLFMIIPYFYRKEYLELYVLKIFTGLSITFIYSFVLYAGLSIILFTINKLLNVPVTENLYISTGFAVMGIFAPIFFLAKIPRSNEDINIKEYPHILKILLLYIVMPLISIYTFILYIYFVKILIIQQWPEGLVTHLVLWYAIISIITIFFISPLQQKNSWVKSFSLWLPRTLIPLLVMMFFAISIRINSYGVTENRYYVVLLGIWVMGIAFYYIFSRKKNNIILPLSLAIITLLAAFGPWSSYSISIYSQNNRFEKIIQKYNMVKENTIVKSDEKITEKDQREIEAILRYFEYNHQFDDLKYLPDNFTANDTEELFGFTYQERYNSDQLQYFSYNLNRNRQAISVKNYGYFFHISNCPDEVTNPNPDEKLTVKFNNLNKEIVIIESGIEIYRQSLIPILVELHLKNKDIPVEEVNPEEFVCLDENKDIILKYIFNSFNGSIEKANPDNINIKNVDFYLFLK